LLAGVKGSGIPMYALRPVGLYSFFISSAVDGKPSSLIQPYNKEDEDLEVVY